MDKTSADFKLKSIHKNQLAFIIQQTRYYTLRHMGAQISKNKTSKFCSSMGNTV